jgi:hypothetical protein
MKPLTKKHFTVLIFCLLTIGTFAQNLLPSIGLGSLPNDSDPISYFQCSIDVDGTFLQVGPQPGDTMPNFTFYDVNDNTFKLSAALNTGKPVLVLGGSYTCPYFRSRRNLINNIVSNYSADLTVAVIYTIEAHPDNDSSIYFCDTNQHQSNVNQGILYDMADTYGERKATVNDMLNNTVFNAPVYLDGPGNEWLTYFGPAPSNAYLIDTNGIIFTKHGWFNQAPFDIIYEIDSLLGNATNPPNPLDGTFGWTIVDSVATGSPVSEITAYGLMTNNSTGDAMIEIVRMQQNLPNPWTSAMCVDVCLPHTADTTLLLLQKDSTEDFHMHFNTGQLPNTGDVLVSFRNLNDPGNYFEQRFYGDTHQGVGVGEMSLSSSEVAVYPNPGNGQHRIRINSDQVKTSTEIRLVVYSLHGQQVDQFSFKGNGEHPFSLNNPASGLYTYQLFGDESYLLSGKLMVQ